MTTEIVLMWVALTCYVVATALFIFGVTFTKDTLVRRAVGASALGLVPQIAALAIRWVRVGHGPYIGYYEVTNGLVLFVVAVFVLVAWRNRRLSAVGVGIMPVAVLLLGGAMLAPKGGLPLTPNLASYWLFIHVAFANLAFAAFVASFGLAIAYIVRKRSANGTWARRLAKLPAQEVLSELTTRFVLAGFLFWGAMIVSGAIWANQAWGRYWGWDPIETWSLIVWVVYAIYLHLRFTRGWAGERLAWFAVIAMPVSLFALLGTPIVFNSIHGGYIGGKDG
ncbi:MAG: cytochrome c biogenesis protein CcsA [Actinomycetia bacterium]|nr:cytochrome c biogenesis protein CcsA [Actinomycetes bacterium]